MAFQVRTERRELDGKSWLVYVLEDTTSGSRAELWPELGFNCVSWQAPHRGELVDLLWSDPAQITRQPTRCGIPILFPFPNRIRGGRFSWQGRDYTLPINDPQQRNAIHGFAGDRPWRVLDPAAHEEHASVTGVFRRTLDAPECARLWPGDDLVHVHCSLQRDALLLSIMVMNPGHVDLPFGFGLHPYFRLPPETTRVELSPGPFQRWVLEECLPAGERVALAGKYLRLIEGDASLGEESFDDAFHTNVDFSARLFDAARGLGVRMTCAGGFHDVVIFTPPHRQAVCLEPYTCSTDAINLQVRAIDAGLRVLGPSQQWQGTVCLERIPSDF